MCSIFAPFLKDGLLVFMNHSLIAMHTSFFFNVHSKHIVSDSLLCIKPLSHNSCSRLL